MFKIGNIEIKNRVILAPMAGVTNRAYRLIVKNFNPGYMCTEMTSSVALKHGSKRTEDIAFVGEDEGIVALQIFGGDVEDYINAAKYYDKNSNAKIIDINMGCPVKKVAIKSEAGSALIKTPEKIKHIIEGITKEISKPLTVKIRIGWDKDNVNYLEIAKIIEAAGASALIIHGRTREQMYSGKANWDAIKEIKETIKIPVIGNGDVFKPEDAQRMIDYTGVDAVMVARAARVNPRVLKQMNDFIKYKKYDSDPSIEIIKQDMNDFIKYMLEDFSEAKTLAQAKGVASQWFSKFKHLQKEKEKFMSTKNLDIFLETINNLK